MKTTSKLSFLLFAISAFISLNIQSQNVTTPRLASQASEVKQTIGFTDITVNYSRPKLTSARGVDRGGKIWGQLVPYGFNKSFRGIQSPWRAGANENTTITFTDAVKVEGKELAAGIYGLHMAIHENGKATIIFSTNSTSWGSYFYDESEDVLRVDVSTNKTAKTEILTYDFTQVGNDFTVLSLKWDEKEIPFKISVDLNGVVMQNFRDELRSTRGFSWQGPQSAAAYCLANNVNLEEALTWANTAVQRNSTFTTLITKAGILNALGKSVEANTIIDQAAANATTAQINALGYQFLGTKQYDKAIEYFKKNVMSDSKNANSYDSLGDAYKAKGDKKSAIKSYKKALKLNPAANVKAASEASLKALGAM